MGDYTASWTVCVGAGRLFNDQLALLAIELELEPPEFRGRLLPSVDQEEGQWEIQTIIWGRRTEPTTRDIFVRRMYPNWERGVEMAMQDALARACRAYRGDLTADSVFHHFGRRDTYGDSLRAGGDKYAAPWCTIQKDDLEAHLVNMEKLLEDEMKTTHELRKEARNLRASEEKLKSEVNELKTGIMELTFELGDQDYKIAAQDAQIAALKRQIPPPPPQEAEDEVEEEPELRVVYTSDGEEIPVEKLDAPAMNTRTKKRKTMAAREFVKLFKLG